MTSTRIALVTQYDGVETHDDGPLLLGAFERAGVEAEIVPWGPPRDWSSYDLVAIRNTWDYLDRRDEFLAWARAVEAVTRLANPSPVLDWNSDKRYLRDMARAGVPIIPTVWVGAGDEDVAVIADLPWDEVVVKPAVSAGARATARYGPGDRDRLSAHVGSLVDAGATVMVQPYVTDVDAHGESGTYVFGGRPSHAIRKGAILLPGAEPPTDFTLAIGQEAVALPLTPDLAGFAEAALRVVRERFGEVLYARVDAVRADDGSVALLELELIEPFLFLDTDPPAADRFVDAVLAAIA